MAQRGTSTAELFGTGSFPVSTEEPAAGHSRAEAFYTIIMTVKSHQKKKKKKTLIQKTNMN